MQLLAALGNSVAGWLYYALLESSTRQATIGKQLFKLRVTDLNGQQITFLRATGRILGKTVSALIFWMGYVMAGVTDRKQALHDMMAGCLVLKTHLATPPPEIVAPTRPAPPPVALQ